MTARKPRYSKEEMERRGTEIYESKIRSQVEEGNHGRIVAIDVETEAFEMADETLEAVKRLYDRVPDAQPWILRIGHRAVFRFPRIIFQNDSPAQPISLQPHDRI